MCFSFLIVLRANSRWVSVCAKCNREGLVETVWSVLVDHHDDRIYRSSSICVA